MRLRTETEPEGLVCAKMLVFDDASRGRAGRTPVAAARFPKLYFFWQLSALLKAVSMAPLI